jgi:two-component system, NarL family, nitrate/nitrite response regulator NarL
MGVRCLIVDDSLRFLEAAGSRLSRGGTAVVGTATTSAEALQEAERLRPDVVLVDVSLGEENGIELSHELAARFDGDLKIVLISTRAEQDLVELLVASPAVGFIPKSKLSPNALLDLLAER